MSAPPGLVRMGARRGRMVLAATVLGSAVAFLDATVVNVALPEIGRDLGAEISGLQWVLTAYLLTLGSLIVLGGSLGDLYGRRRVYQIGLVGFGAASLLCGIAPTLELLIAARALQGVAAALLVPGSLAIISASFAPDQRGRAIGAWSGLAGISTAVGPFLGGWLVDAASWRLVFLVNLPVIAVTVVLTHRWVPESRDERADRRVDVVGGVTLALGLAGIVYALIEGPALGATPTVVATGALGAIALAVFVVAQMRGSHPMVPLEMFRNPQFSGANAVTLAVYGALGTATFVLVLELQEALGYSALASGAALLPVTLLMFSFSARTGALAQRIGPRLPMTVGPIVVAAGLGLLAGVGPGSTYLTGVLPGVVVLGAGLTFTVAPLTAAVLGAIETRHAGVGAAINNAVARIASLLAIAALPAVAGLDDPGADLTDGYRQAMLIAAAVAAIGGVLAFLTIRRGASVVPVTQPSVAQGCSDPCVELPGRAA